MPKFLKGVFIVGLALMSLSLCSQTITVLEKINNSSLPAVAGATVRLYNVESDLEFKTDQSGKSPLPSDWKSKTLIVTASGLRNEIVEPGSWFGNELLVVLKPLNVQLIEYEVKATRIGAPIEDLPADIYRIRNPQKDNPRNMADVLEQSGDVFVQKSQLGGGSPVIRGMEANRILLVVDGVRLNTPIFRGGHLQNVLRLDPNATEDVEIVHGSSSPLYGSDALGGVVSVTTKQAQLGRDYGMTNTFGGLVKIAAGDFRFWNQEQGGNIWHNAGFNKFAIRTSVTFNRYGDLRQGNSGMRDEWRDDFFVSRVAEVDSILVNNDPAIQRNSGYSQFDINQKWLFAPKKGPQHKLNLQYSTTSNVNRYDRLSNEDEDGLPVFSEWYYGPEQRALVAYHLEFRKKTKFFNEGKVVAAWQMNKESRNTRRFRDLNLVSRKEQVNSFSLNADFFKRIKKYRLYYGIEAYRHLVDSYAEAKNISTGSNSPASTRYPAEGSFVNNSGAYITVQREHLPQKRLISTFGVRYTFNDLFGRFGNSEFYDFPFSEVQQRNSILSGQAGIVYRISKKLTLNAQWSQGFRAPNIDDVAKVFDSQPGSLIIPNANLKSERTNSFDSRLVFNHYDKLIVDFGGFYTFFHDAIVIRPSQFNGQDSLLYEGVLSAIQQSANAEEALLYGCKFRLTLNFFKTWTFTSNLTYSAGSVVSSSPIVPLDHIPPLFGKFSVRKVFSSKLRFGAWIMFHGDKPLNLYSPSGEDNLQYATAQGMPSWYTLNADADFKINDRYNLKLSLENILDVNYRVFASGISAPGRLFRCMIVKNF